MATIALYADKVNQMPGLIMNIIQAVNDYKSELIIIRNKLLSINKSVCDLNDVIDQIQNLILSQEEKISSLETFYHNCQQFIAETNRIDGSAADLIKRRSDAFYEEYYYLKPDLKKNKFLDGLMLTAVTGKGHVRFLYDKSSLASMAEYLGIDPAEFIATMQYQYGFDENISQIYLELYLAVATSDKMKWESKQKIACEFNRIAASLCIDYSGKGDAWRLTVGNYVSGEAYNLLIDTYGLSEANAIDFTIAVNVQHGKSYEDVEAHFNFSRMEGNNLKFKEAEPPGLDDFKKISSDAGSPIIKDFPHEAVQFVEFNDDFDLVDIVSGNTERMISYSGDIISTSHSDSDFLANIDAFNIQKRFADSEKSFISVLQDYNKAIMTGTINAKNEFVAGNNGIDNIRKNIELDIKSLLGSQLYRGNIGLLNDFFSSFADLSSYANYLKENKRLEELKSDIDKFIDFLEK